MATLTLGTNATTSLTALLFKRGIGSMVAADQATLNNAILDDLNVAHPRVRGAFDSQGLLTIPNRGILKVLPGDYVGVDDQGWPILVSAYSIANGLWTHS
jgi:hypothetical protein